MSDATEQVTRLLNEVTAGKGQAASELLPVVYEELRRLAAAKMAREPPGQTLQATALVHEAWLRLVAPGSQTWQNRAHFFGAAAEAMRRILVENARRKRQLKRGGQWERVELKESQLSGASVDDKILLVDEALAALAKEDPVEVKVVELHYFVGLNHREIAEVLGVSERTVKRYWAYARVWLYRHIQEAGPG
jgi:RNA polymerase sigma factor (TIGR02999 family)